MARHTFATVALANRISMESVVKMLGHTDIRTTKYTRGFWTRPFPEEMKGIRSKFSIRQRLKDKRTTFEIARLKYNHPMK